jgi:hypothetical protein
MIEFTFDSFVVLRTGRIGGDGGLVIFRVWRIRRILHHQA